MKGLLAALAVLILLGAAFWYFDAKAPTEPQAPAPAFSYANATSDDIQVAEPLPGNTVGHSVTITGTARGPWYFEASFPASIEDPQGRVIDEEAAQAEGEWMTQDFVPFSVTLQIPPNYSGPATIFLKNDNPSGDPAREKTISYPVVVGQ